MRVLVIGGTGLISTAIVEKLLADGHEPVLFNRGATASRLSQAVETVTGDRQDFTDFSTKAAAIQAEAVIDMITFNPDTARNAVEVFSGRVQHYLFCSTVCVYGGPLSTVPADEDEPHTPSGEYGRLKSESEAAFLEAHDREGFPVTMFRPSHCYGPGRPLLDIFGYNATLVNRIREGKPILVPGDGHGLWQPGYIGDMAKGFVGALAHPDATVGKAYNLVGDEIMTWREFHETMGRALGHEVELIAMTTAQIMAASPAGTTGMLDEIFQYPAAYSNGRLKADVPEYVDLLSFEEGVRRNVAWMDETGAHESSDSQPWLDALIEKERAFRESL
jgi:nucleoside-diphosphate-sugar epimerase